MASRKLSTDGLSVEQPLTRALTWKSRTYSGTHDCSGSIAPWGGQGVGPYGSAAPRTGRETGGRNR
jgi:hypothetical protein